MTTAEDIYGALETRQGERNGFNRWLGASMIGHPCQRFVALSFRCAFHNEFKGKTLRIFENGNRAEDRIVADLEAPGKIKVLSRQHTVDMPDGLGHAGVTLDGVAFEDGIYHVLEMKTMNAKGWKELSEKGVMQAKRQHYCQMQFGMALTGLMGALYVAENKDTNELYLEYVRYNDAAVDVLLALARAVIAGKELPRCSERPDWYECKWCPAHGMCHGDAFPRAHCLTCCHSTPAAGGTWTCAKWGAEIPKETLPQGCAEHIYVPWLVHLPVEGWGEYWVTYRLPNGGRLCNCTGESFPAVDGGPAPAIMTSAAMEQKKCASALLR
jgi:hypothetical protein